MNPICTLVFEDGEKRNDFDVLRKDPRFLVLSCNFNTMLALGSMAQVHPELVILSCENWAQWERCVQYGVVGTPKHVPKAAVYAKTCADEIASKMYGNGASCFFVLPTDPEALANRLWSLVRGAMHCDEKNKGGGYTQPSEADIVGLLRQMSVPPHLLGYRYLREAIALIVAKMDRIKAVTGVYEEVAKRYGTTKACVERSMRHAIESAWSRCPAEQIERVFGYTLKLDKDKPSNSEFLAMLSDRVSVKRRGA